MLFRSAGGRGLGAGARAGARRANSPDLRDSSAAWGCLVHALSACVSQTLLLSPPRGDTSVPAFTLLSHTRAWYSLTRPLCPEQTRTPPRLLGLALPDKAGQSTPVGTAE